MLGADGAGASGGSILTSDGAVVVVVVSSVNETDFLPFVFLGFFRFGSSSFWDSSRDSIWVLDAVSEDADTEGGFKMEWGGELVEAEADGLGEASWDVEVEESAQFVEMEMESSAGVAGGASAGASGSGSGVGSTSGGLGSAIGSVMSAA